MCKNIQLDKISRIINFKIEMKLIFTIMIKKSIGKTYYLRINILYKIIICLFCFDFGCSYYKHYSSSRLYSNEKTV